MARILRFSLVLAIVVSTTACALSLRNPRISDLQRNPGRYQHQRVSIEGVVTTSWGVPMSPFRMYRIDDGTGEVTVLSQGRRMPTRGARVRVRGRVDDLAVLGGRAYGLHLTEESLYVKR